MDTPFRRGARLVVLFLACALSGFAASAQPTDPAPLGLEAQVNGSWIKVLGVDQKRLLGQGPAGNCAIPATAPLRLVGDLVAHPELVEAATSFDLVERPAPAGSDRPPTFLANNIRPAAEFVAGPGTCWQPAQPEKAVLLCLWQVAGRPAHLRTLPLQRHPDNHAATKSCALDISPEETPGNPVFLLFENGQVLPKQVAAEHSAADRLGVLVALGQDELVATDLSRLGKVPATPKGAPSLLHRCAQAGAIQSVEALLRLGAPVKAKADDGSTALHLAARAGRTAVVERLIAAKAALTATDAEKNTPLHLAASGAHTDVCRLLLDAGASVNSQNNYGHTPALRAFLADCTPAVELFQARKADFNFANGSLPRLLVQKSAGGQPLLVQIVLAEHVDSNANWMDQTALIAAAREGHDEVVAQLLAAKADPNRANKKGVTPLIVAAARGRTTVVNRLLAAGASPLAASKGGHTALHAASFAGSAPTVQALLAAGVPPTRATDKGVQSLTLAVGSGSRETVAALLAGGATVVPNNPHFEAELSNALAMDSDAFLASALKAGMPIDYQTAKGWSALQLATIGKAERCAALLRAAGAKEPDSTAAAAVVASSQLEKRPALLELHPTIDPRDPEESDFAATTVVVETLVGKDGIPAFARATCEDCRLSLSAVQTVLRSKFQPALKGGEPVATQVRIPIVFREREERTFDFSALDVKPEVLSRVAPIYPFNLKRNGITGTAVVQFLIESDGRVSNIVVVAATDSGFADSAVAAIRKWRFKPGILDGKAVACRMQQSFPFMLSN